MYVLTVKQEMRLPSNGGWKARKSEHHSRSSRAAFWNPVGDDKCYNGKIYNVIITFDRGKGI